MGHYIFNKYGRKRDAVSLGGRNVWAEIIKLTFITGISDPPPPPITRVAFIGNPSPGCPGMGTGWGPWTTLGHGSLSGYSPGHGRCIPLLNIPV